MEKRLILFFCSFVLCSGVVLCQKYSKEETALLLYNNPDSCIQWVNQQDLPSKEKHIILSDAYFSLRDYVSAFEQLEKINTTQPPSYYDLWRDYYLARLLEYTNSMPQALETYQRFYDESQEHGCVECQITYYNKIGDIHMTVSNTDLATEAYQKAFNLSLPIKNAFESDYYESLYNLIKVQHVAGRLGSQSTIDSLESIHRKVKELSIPKPESYIRKYLVQLYLENDDVINAKRLLSAALQSKTNSTNLTLSVSILTDLADIEYKSGDKTSSYRNLQRALSMTYPDGNLIQRVNILETMLSQLKGQGRYQEVSDLQNKLLNAEANLHEDSRLEALFYHEKKMATKQKNQKIGLLQSNITQLINKNRQSNVLNIIFGSLALLILAMLIFLIRQFRIIRSKNNTIEDLLDQAYRKNEQLVRVNKELNQSIENQLNKKESIDTLVTIKCGTKQKTVKKSEIYYIAAEDEGTRIYLDDSSFWSDLAMKDVIKLLKGEMFTKVHRSYSINILQVDWITSSEIKLKNETIVPMSRTYKTKINEILNLN